MDGAAYGRPSACKVRDRIAATGETVMDLKSIFERNGKYKFLHLVGDDRPFGTLVESVESESIFDMDHALIEVSSVSNLQHPTEQDYLRERNRLEQEGWQFCSEIS